MAYIERESAIKSLLNDSPEQVGYSREDAADCIRYMDADDVVPVRHGRWIKHDDGVFTCSECENAESNESHFCRYCGAKMMEG